MEGCTINKKYSVDDLERILDNFPYLIWIKDQKNRYRYVNKYFLTTFKKTEKEIIGKTELNNYNGEYVLVTEENLIKEVEFNENKRYFSVYKTVLPTGTKYNWELAVARDVTLLKKEMTKRSKIQRRLESFLEISTDLWGILQANYHFKDVSDNCIKTFGWTSEEFKNLNAVNLTHPDDREHILKKMDFSFNKDKRTFLLNRFLCKNGKYKLIEWNWCCLEEGKTVLLTGRDITEKKELEEEKRRLEEAIAMESLKTEFFSTVSHEFKTPLNVILSTVQLLSDKLKNNKLSEEVKVNLKYINGIKQNSYRLLKLVNNLIDITQIDGGIYKLSLENCNIVSIIENIVLSASKYIHEKNRNIIFDTTIEEIILAIDCDKIERIILNLLSNAVKYTNNGGNIYVSLSMDTDNNNVIVKIKDDGIGIPEKDVENIFRRFKQSGDVFTRRCEGTGIGLSIVRSLIEMHGGAIKVNKEIKKGAEFVFYLPIIKMEDKDVCDLYDKRLDSRFEKYNIEFSDIY
ncbi:ATP-binding protein [Clostridium sp. ZBS15]|uniref:PAS domain-containing sensor histidine kinase n=1 Tax=Clostridium sp. ZBS15 TaxID=2949969 RepID=UPI002079523B|nr:ATP-binding protein [Clostridium sp. ZBS15]